MMGQISYRPSEDLPFAGHDQTLRIRDLWFSIQLCEYHTDTHIRRQLNSGPGRE